MELDTLFMAYPNLIHKTFSDYKPPLELQKLNRTQIKTLVILHYNPHWKMSTISGHLNLKKGSFTTVIDSLIEYSFIEKKRDEKDRRAFELTLTDSGLRLVLQHVKKAGNHLKDKFSSLPAESYEKFVNAIIDIYEISKLF